MPLITEAEVRARGQAKAYARYKSAGAVLNEGRSLSTFAEDAKTYTIFLSHSFKDQFLILGLKEYLESLGYSVYVDWIDDRELDRSRVTKDTAARLRWRMRHSRSLFFATTDNSPGSKWMPWELGYFDALRSRCAILPLAQAPNTEDSYAGQEYLGLYPYVVRTPIGGRDVLYVHTSKKTWVKFDDWLTGSEPAAH